MSTQYEYETPIPADAEDHEPKCCVCGQAAQHRVVTTVNGRWVPGDRWYCEACRRTETAPFIQHL